MRPAVVLLATAITLASPAKAEQVTEAASPLAGEEVVVPTEAELDEARGGYVAIILNGGRWLIKTCASKAACRKIVAGASSWAIGQTLTEARKQICARYGRFC